MNPFDKIPLPPSFDDRPKKNGWAAGDYFRTCRYCGRNFLGDKRAVQCAPCAYQDADSRPSDPSGGSTPQSEEKTVSTATVTHGKGIL